MVTIITMLTIGVISPTVLVTIGCYTGSVDGIDDTSNNAQKNNISYH